MSGPRAWALSAGLFLAMLRFDPVLALLCWGVLRAPLRALSFPGVSRENRRAVPTHDALIAAARYVRALLPPAPDAVRRPRPSVG